MVGVSDKNAPIRPLDLRVTTQAEIGVALDEHLLINRAVWVMANRAALAQGFVLEHIRTRLLAVALRATLVLPGHGQPAVRFENITAMRIVAWHATHVSFDDRVMLRQIEFGLNIQMALETRRGIIGRVDDEFCVAAGFNVFAAGTMAGFTAGLANHGRVLKMNPRMRTGGKFPDDLRVTIQAGLVSDTMRAGNFQRHHHFSGRGGTGIQKDGNETGRSQRHEDDRGSPRLHPALRRLEHDYQRAVG